MLARELLEIVGDFDKEAQVLVSTDGYSTLPVLSVVVERVPSAPQAPDEPERSTSVVVLHVQPRYIQNLS